MNLGETQLSAVVLKGWCFYVEVSLPRLCVPSVFGVRTGFDGGCQPCLLQGVLATITLMEYG